MGLLAGLLLSLREKGEERTTQSNPKYTGNSISVTISLLGAVVLFTVFPIIVMDPELGTEIEIFSDAYPLSPLSIWYSMAAAAISASAFSFLFNGNLIPRDLINGTVAGGVASTTASVYLANPVWAMVLGAGAGFFQTLFQSTIEKSRAKKGKIINTHSFFLFGFQGLWGGAYASIFRKVI